MHLMLIERKANNDPTLPHHSGPSHKHLINNLEKWRSERAISANSGIWTHCLTLTVVFPIQLQLGCSSASWRRFCHNVVGAGGPSSRYFVLKEWTRRKDVHFHNIVTTTKTWIGWCWCSPRARHAVQGLLPTDLGTDIAGYPAGSSEASPPLTISDYT